jgi:hypothetical protein
MDRRQEVKTGLGVLFANVPSLLLAAGGGLLADYGHEGFGIACFVMAFFLMHTSKSKGEE